MKKVLIHAYTHFNFGDDLFIQILCQRYPQTSFYLYAPKAYKQSFSDLRNLTIIPNDTYLAKAANAIGSRFKTAQPLLHLAKKCDAVVQIGGSLFMETKHWHAEWQKTAALRKASMAFFLLGSNFGPFQQKAFYRKYKQLFATYTDICFRETYSYNLFTTLENVRSAPDIVFSLPLPERSAGHVQPINARPKLVISVIKPSIRPHLAAFDDIYYEKMREIAIYFIHAGFAVTFAAFCSYEGDKVAMQSITSQIPEAYRNDISTYVHQSNPAETIRLLNQASMIIASRFHAMIVGWVLEKPVFPIIYSKKMSHVMDDIGFTGSTVDFEQLVALEPATIHKHMAEGAPDIGKQRQQAQNHFAKLDSFLEEE